MAPKVTAVIDAPRVSGRNTGVAPRIRKIKLRYPELSEAQIAKRVGCSPVNVHKVLTKFLGDDGSEGELADFQQSKANIFDALQQRILMSITSADIEKAPLLPRITASAILEDKARVIRGQATQINVVALLDAVQAVREMRKTET